jgi:hypothetical protein
MQGLKAVRLIYKCHIGAPAQQGRVYSKLLECIRVLSIENILEECNPNY